MSRPASTAIKRQAAACVHRADAETGMGLAELAYELLDAHTDTAPLIDGLAYDPSWAAHLDYLRALHMGSLDVR